MRHWLRGWSLRTRLIAALVGVVAAVCVLMGVVSEFAVYTIQYNQLDQRLTAMAGHPPRTAPQDDPTPPPDAHGEPPGPDAYVSVVIAGGQVLQPDTNAGARAVSAADYATLTGLPVDDDAEIRTLDGSDYLLLARRTDAGILVTGLPMGQVYTQQLLVGGVEIGISLVALLLAGFAGAYIVRRTMRPLDQVAATARRVAELPLDRGEVALSVRVPDVDARTEVGQVGAALNRMLRHVANALAVRQASETRVRHFVADASHELRTPLAAIRGYAELSRRFGADVPPDVAHAMRRVESESARMTVLVEDLLLLARLDSGRPLDTEPVDLTRLAIDAVSDAHVAGPDHRWQLDLPDESVTVTGDPARLHQVLANLLANGRAHTPPGSTITTSVRPAGDPAGDEVTLCVADDGPGIPPDLLPEVFDRFARGDSSRSRAAGSTGLGLAIVAAVVEAHQGSVEVTSEPGRTAFTVRLPAGPAATTAAAADRAPAAAPGH